MPTEIVLVGGVSFAVEVASFICDINRQLATSSWGSGASELQVTDIVTPESIRLDDIQNLIGRRLGAYREAAAVPNIEKKSAVVCIGDALIRHKVYKELSANGAKLENIIHPTACISSSASIGSGCIVGPFAYVGPYSRVGDNVTLNVQVVVGHDAVVQTSAVLSPGSCVNGHANCGVASFLGAGAIVLPRVSLGNYSKLSAGSVLKDDTGDGFVMHGNPAKGRQFIQIPVE